MADFGAIQEAIRVWWEETTGLNAVWENASPKHHVRGVGYGVVTRPTGIKSIGQDYIKYTPGDPPSQLIPVVVARRQCSMLCKVIVRAHDPLRHATFYTEKARMSLVKPSILEHFQANDIAIIRANPTANYYLDRDKHTESISAFELIFSYVTSDSDTSTGTIGSIGLSSTLKNTDGTELTHPPNLTDEIFSGVE